MSTAEGGAAIEAEGLGRDFGERTALHDVSFSLPRGEPLAVVGPNGAGKSTLLRIAAGLLRPHRGRVTVLGAELPGEVWRIRGRIGFLGHEALLYRDLTVTENLAFHAELHGIPVDEAADRAAELLAAVEMAARAGERVGDLSRGMAQRVGACRVLLHRPELVLLDEPRAHLDPHGSELVDALLASEAPGRIEVTHSLRQDAPPAGKVLALDARGRRFHFGRVDELDRERLDALYGEPVR